MKIQTLIADDEPLARSRVRRLLQDESDIEIVAECADGEEALREIERLEPELVFLDVQMPGLDGFQVLEEIELSAAPVIVFVTAFSEFALRAFDAHALDYLLKPFDAERFSDAVERARSAVRLRRKGESDQRLEALLEDLSGQPRYLERIVVRTGGRILFLRVAEVDWIGAEGNYAALHMGQRSHLLRETMAALERKLDPRHFIRIHRSTIVNIERIREFAPMFKGEYEILLEDGTRLTSSRAYRGQIHLLMEGGPGVASD